MQMLSYELSKKLKDLGYPQPVYSFKTYARNSNVLNEKTEEAYMPTSDELIEALGDDFNELSKQIDFDTRAFKEYRAYAWEGAEIHISDKVTTSCDPYCCGYGVGQTPVEALANLYVIRHDTRTPR